MGGGDLISFPTSGFSETILQFFKGGIRHSLVLNPFNGNIVGVRVPGCDKFDLRGKFLISNPSQFHPNLSGFFPWGKE
jgi:hypothetical protein